ncbi:MAG: hypothetical protein L0387_35945 [Acidobacteria bacterium]|nr:hypothetical protein [Acidobacteriota bacterium]
MTTNVPGQSIVALIGWCLRGLLLYSSLAALKALAELPAVPAEANCNGYGSPAHLADLEYQSINESSGIAASKRNASLFWTHNDSGDGPFIYAFDRQGKHRGVWRVIGAKAQDWEDMAIGPGPKRGGSYLYIGDIGDNSEKRREIIVYRVAEPLISSEDSSSTNQSPRATQPADVFRLKYPDGKHNAETLLVHPSTGDLYIVTKVTGAPAGVYKLRAPLPKSEVSILAHIRDVRFPNPLIGVVTGGAISPDGRRVILCDYLEACELVLPEKPGTAFDEIWKQPPVPVTIGTRIQGEAICYRADGSGVLATSEQLPCPLIEITRRIRER